MKARYSLPLLVAGFVGGAAWLAAGTPLEFWQSLELLVGTTILWFAVLVFDVEEL